MLLHIIYSKLHAVQSRPIQDSSGSSTSSPLAQSFRSSSRRRPAATQHNAGNSSSSRAPAPRGSRAGSRRQEPLGLDMPAAQRRTGQQQQQQHQQQQGRQQQQQADYQTFGQAQMSPARLTAAIQQQATLAGLQALLSRHSSLVNAIHVAAALQWLVSHPQQQPQAPDQLSQLVQQWVALVAVKQESARSCVSLIYSCSRLGVVQEVGLYTPLLQRFMEVKQEADARMLSNLLYALGSRPQLKGLLQPPVLVALLQQLNQVAHTAIPQALANALWSAAKVEQPPGDSSRLLREVVAQLLGKFLNILQEAQPQDVSNTLYALALLPQAWPMDSALQLVEKMVVLLPQARPQAASNVLWALGWYVEQGWLKPLGGVPDAGLQAAVDQLLSHLAAAGGGVKPQEVSNSLWAAAVLQAQVDWRVVGRLMESVSRGRPAPQALSNAAWAVATLQQLLDASSPAQYVNQQQQQVWQRPFSRAAQVFATLLPQASQQEIANMVWACGVVRHYPQQLLQALTAAAAPPPQLAQATPQAVANLAWALAVLAPEPPPTTLLASLLQRVQELLAQQQPCGIGSQELANTAWALAVLDQQQLASKLIPLAAAAFSPQHWGSVRREGLLQWHQVQLWLTDTQALGPAGLGEVPGVTQQQLEACAAAWEEQLVRQVSPSGVQREVAQVLTNMPGVEVVGVEQRDAADASHSIDTVVRYQNQLLAVEVDGPVHFTWPGQRVTGDTLARNRALEQRGYKVVTVPVSPGWSQQQQQQREEYLLQQLMQAAVSHPATSAAPGVRSRRSTNSTTTTTSSSSSSKAPPLANRQGDALRRLAAQHRRQAPGRGGLPHP